MTLRYGDKAKVKTMNRSTQPVSMKNGKLLSLLLLASMPLLTGCNLAAVSTVTFGTVLWYDIALIPVRSFLGGTALQIINTL